MNLVTQCPQCAQVFQVLPEAHPAQAGWVRCVQCTHAFEAAAFAVTAPFLDASALSESLLTSPRVDVEALLRRQDVPVAVAPSPPLPSAVLAEPVAPTSSPLSAHNPTPVTLTASVPQPWAAGAPDPLEPELPWTAPMPEPLHPADTAAAPSGQGWHRALAWALLAGLVCQALYFFRDETASRWPSAQSAWAALCQPLACQVQSLRRWGGIVIDSSALVRGDEAYTLNLALRNSTELPLAMTALELTLTDEQDRVLVRRVLTPKVLGAPEALQPGQVWDRAFRVELTDATTEVAGYRLVSFYP